MEFGREGAGLAGSAFTRSAIEKDCFQLSAQFAGRALVQQIPLMARPNAAMGGFVAEQRVAGGLPGNCLQAFLADGVMASVGVMTASKEGRGTKRPGKGHLRSPETG